MASGDTLFILKPEGSSPPGTLFATHDIVADGSTPTMNIPVLDYDGATSEHMDWFVTIPTAYSGATGFTFSFKYAMDGADGNIVEMEFRAVIINDQVIISGDLGIDTQTATTITDDPDSTSNDFNYSTTGTMAKANFGSAASNSFICIRATRDITVAANADDLQLAEILVRET